jgi:hypothetical protein
LPAKAASGCGAILNDELSSLPAKAIGLLAKRRSYKVPTQRLGYPRAHTTRHPIQARRIRRENTLFANGAGIIAYLNKCSISKLYHRRGETRQKAE